LGEPSIQTGEGRRREEAVKFATCFGESVQSVTLQQCGGLILFSSECRVNNMPSVHSKLGSKTSHFRAKKLSQTYAVLKKERQVVKIQWL
jgi:hypothetical protein